MLYWLPALLYVAKFDEFRALSTPEFGRTDEAGFILRVGDPPEINRNPTNQEDIDHLEHAVPDIETALGGSALFCGEVRKVLRPLESGEFGT